MNSLRLKEIGLSDSTISTLAIFGMRSVEDLVEDCRNPILDHVRFFSEKTQDEIYNALENIGVKCRLTGYEEMYCAIFANEPHLRGWLMRHPFPAENLPALIDIIKCAYFDKEVMQIIPMRYGLFGDRPMSVREVHKVTEMPVELIHRSEQNFLERMRNITRVGKVRMLRYTREELYGRISLFERDLRDMRNALSLSRQTQ